MNRLIPVLILISFSAFAQNARWTEQQANEWYAKQPWLVGANYSPATAINVAVTDTLPPGMSFVSGTPAGYILNGNKVTFPNLDKEAWQKK